MGTEDARDKAKAAWPAAWDLSNLINGTEEDKLSRMRPTFDAFSAAAKEFFYQAENEVVP